jgi:hypothetical protein
MQPPIELTLYDEKDEPKETFQRNVIPWGLLKKAISIQKIATATSTQQKMWWEFWKTSEESTVEEAQMRAISQFVVELFGNRFTVKELETGADIGEIMTVFKAVIARANASVIANPTPPPSSRK